MTGLKTGRGDMKKNLRGKFVATSESYFQHLAPSSTSSLTSAPTSTSTSTSSAIICPELETSHGDGEEEENLHQKKIILRQKNSFCGKCGRLNPSFNCQENVVDGG